VPSDHGVRFDEYQDIRSAGPTPAECCPEQPVQGVQLWPWPFPLQHGDLLSEGEDFESYIASTTEEESMISGTNIPFKHAATALRRANAAESQVADFRSSRAFVYGRILPYLGFKLIGSCLGVAANAFASKPVTVCSGTSILPEIPHAVAFPSLASRLSVERISTKGAASQPLKEMARPPQSKSRTGAVFAELLLSCGE
jgi:hypothetical protein